jgi:hypothetical protein
MTLNHLCCFANDSTLPKKQIKLDLISIYNTIFDVREQYRLGIEYQFHHNHSLSSNFHLDFGQYDKYEFYKYHNYYSPDFYFNRSTVSTYGFHFIYGLKKTFKRPNNKKISYFTSLCNDVNIFRKIIKDFNSKTNESTDKNNNQFRLGLGPELGLEFKLYKNIKLEAKSVVFINLLTLKLNPESPNIKPYKGVWYDINHNFWIIPRLNICYEL